MSKTLSFVGLSNIYICIYVVWLKNINLVIITYRKQFVNNGISVCEAPSEAMWWNHVSLRPCVQVMWHVRCLGVDELGVSELHGMSRVRYRGRKWGIHHCIIRVTKGNNSCNSGSWKPLILLPNKTEKLYASMDNSSSKIKVNQFLSILIKHIVGLSVCLFVGLNLSSLKSERYETRHVGPLGTWNCHRHFWIST